MSNRALTATYYGKSELFTVIAMRQKRGCAKAFSMNWLNLLSSAGPVCAKLESAFCRAKVSKLAWTSGLTVRLKALEYVIESEFWNALYARIQHVLRDNKIFLSICVHVWYANFMEL